MANQARNVDAPRDIYPGGLGRPPKPGIAPRDAQAARDALEIGEQIARARKHQMGRLRTQAGLAQAAGVALTTVINIENGKTWADFLTLGRILSALNLQPWHISETASTPSASEEPDGAHTPRLWDERPWLSFGLPTCDECGRSHDEAWGAWVHGKKDWQPATPVDHRTVLRLSDYEPWKSIGASLCGTCGRPIPANLPTGFDPAEKWFVPMPALVQPGQCEIEFDD